MSARNRNYILLVIFLTFLIGTGLNIWISDRTAQEHTQNFCDLVGTLDSTYQQTPPTTPTGKKVAEQMHRLHKDLNCDN